MIIRTISIALIALMIFSVSSNVHYESRSTKIVKDKQNNVNGISDIGIYQNGTTYSYGTTSIMGIADISNLTTNVSTVSFVLAGNFVLNMSGQMATFLFMNVAVYNESNDTIHMEDYVFNEFMSNGQMYRPDPPLIPFIEGKTIPSTSFYFYSTPLYIKVSQPFNLTLRMSEFYRNYHGGISMQYGINNVIITFDQLRFLEPMNGIGNFYVNGSSLTPNGLNYDIEFVIADANPLQNNYISINSSSILFNLEFYNGFNYQTVENTVNYGLIVPDVINNASESTYFAGNGMIYGYMVNGTGTPGYLYTPSQISILNLIMPSLTGIYEINNTYYPIPYYNNGYAIITIAPGNYTLIIKQHMDGTVLIPISMNYVVLANTTINATSGSYVMMNPGSSFQVIFNYINAGKYFIGTEITNILNGKKSYIPPFEPGSNGNYSKYTFLGNGTYMFMITFEKNKIIGDFMLTGYITEINVNMKTGSYNIKYL